MGDRVVIEYQGPSGALIVDGVELMRNVATEVDVVTLERIQMHLPGHVVVVLGEPADIENATTGGGSPEAEVIPAASDGAPTDTEPETTPPAKK